jgi:Cof subfamily protein (haloacid dehalogenase superfamily)
MKPRKLVFLDIDGTLASSFDHVPLSARRVCRAARENGHLLYIATGRSRAQIGARVLALGFDGVISSGGAYIEIGGQVVFSAFIPRAVLEGLIAYFTGRGAGFSLESPEKITANLQFFSSIPHAPLRFLHCYAPLDEDFDKERVCKVVFMESKNVRLEDVREKFHRDFEIFRNSIPIPGLRGGEISAKGIHKGAAAAWVTGHYGMDRKDTIAIGDSDNDRAMLEYAGTGIAMGNSDQVLKQAADDVTGHVRCFGLAKAFRKYGLA